MYSIYDVITSLFVAMGVSPSPGDGGAGDFIRRLGPIYARCCDTAAGTLHSIIYILPQEILPTLTFLYNSRLLLLLLLYCTL